MQTKDRKLSGRSGSATKKTKQKATGKKAQGSSGGNGGNGNAEANTKSSDIKYDVGDIFSGLVSSGSRVVHKAASILEEEIASGIVAAREVEEKFVNVGNVRSQDSDKLMQRFRRDSHDIIDIILDLIDVAVRNTGTVAQKLTTVKKFTQSKKDNQKSQNQLPTIELPETLKPGSSGSAMMAFENAEGKSTGAFRIFSTDLLSSDGNSILAKNIRFKPTTINLKPNSQSKITISVNTPKAAQPGVYSGLIQASGMEYLKAVLIVRVA